jgi:hypothetical protein
MKTRQHPPFTPLVVFTALTKPLTHLPSPISRWRRAIFSPVVQPPLSLALGFLVLRYVHRTGVGGLLALVAVAGLNIVSGLAESLGIFSFDLCYALDADIHKPVRPWILG